MTGLPPCAYNAPCLWDDTEGACPCDDEPEPPSRPIEDVPTGHYL